jgi:excisionase family DNA binding protein
LPRVSETQLDVTREKPLEATEPSVFGERLLTTREVAAQFRTAEKTIRDWIAKGELMAVRYGKQWYISETALRNSKELKEAEARTEMLARRRRSALAAEFERRRAREPQMHWQLSDCVGCDAVQVLTSRLGRDDGLVLCESCVSNAEKLSPEAKERRAVLQVEERNRVANKDVVPAEPWFVYHCVRCGFPRPLSIIQLDDFKFYPWCPSCERENTLDGQTLIPNMDPNVVKALATLQAAELNREVDDPDAWRVCQCVACGDTCAVASREQRSAGTARCRICIAGGRPPDIALRLWLMASELEPRRPGFRIGLGWCSSGHEDTLLEGPEGEDPEPVLSVCNDLPASSRTDELNEFIRDHHLSPAATRLLRGWATPFPSGGKYMMR